jgi:hypothetical protein
VNIGSTGERGSAADTDRSPDGARETNWRDRRITGRNILSVSLFGSPTRRSSGDPQAQRDPLTNYLIITCSTTMALNVISVKIHGVVQSDKHANRWHRCDRSPPPSLPARTPSTPSFRPVLRSHRNYSTSLPANASFWEQRHPSGLLTLVRVRSTVPDAHPINAPPVSGAPHTRFF